jgi:hypothetical protein
MERECKNLEFGREVNKALICQSVGGHDFLFGQIIKDGNLIWQTPADPLGNGNARRDDAACWYAVQPVQVEAQALTEAAG